MNLNGEVVLCKSFHVELLLDLLEGREEVGEEIILSSWQLHFNFLELGVASAWCHGMGNSAAALAD